MPTMYITCMTIQTREVTLVNLCCINYRLDWNFPRSFSCFSTYSRISHCIYLLCLFSLLQSVVDNSICLTLLFMTWTLLTNTGQSFSRMSLSLMIFHNSIKAMHLGLEYHKSDAVSFLVYHIRGRMMSYYWQCSPWSLGHSNQLQWRMPTSLCSWSMSWEEILQGCMNRLISAFTSGFCLWQLILLSLPSGDFVFPSFFLYLLTKSLL